MSTGAIDDVVQQRDQIGPGPHQASSRIGLVRAIEDAVYVEENHPHAAVLSLTKFVLADISGSPRNVEVGLATFVHQQDAPAHEHKEHHADDRYFQHASEGSSGFNRSRPALVAITANTGTIGKRAALAARRWSHE